MSWASSTTRIGQLCSISSSKRIHAREYEETGVPFYRGKEIIEKHRGALTVSVEKFISEKRFREIELKHGAPQSGDLLLTSVGTLGVPYVVKAGERFYFKDGNLTWFRDFEGLDVRFLYFWLLSPAGKEQLKRFTIGSSQPAFTIAGLNDMEIDVPPLPTQQRITAILSAYDDLIETNTRRIAILEEMARRLYEEWFVRFRFPGHEAAEFIETELGLAPDGWPVVQLKDLIQINPRTTVPRDGSKPFVPMGSLSETTMIIDPVEEREGNSGTKFQNGDTLVARITPCLENGKTGFVDFLDDIRPVAFGSTEFIVLRPLVLGRCAIYCMARSHDFRDVAIKSMSGAEGRQRVRPESIQSLPIAQPPTNLLDDFERIAEPLFAQVMTLARKNANLRAQRDLLLPKLVSGEIDVSEAEAGLEAAE